MSKFLAMLKDSYKEAVDGWIFVVMLALSGLLVLIVGSLSADPLPADKALPKVVTGDALRMVSPDRGAGSRLIIYAYQVKLSDVQVVEPGPNRWDDKVRFDLEFTSLGFGPAGVEVDDAKKPTKVKQVDAGLFSDAFKEAVRTWAGTGEEKPKYTDELAKEFITHQLRDAARLNVTGVEKQSGGRFTVTADGATSRIGWPHRPSLFFGLWEMTFLDQPLGDLVFLVEGGLVNSLGAWVVLLAGVIVTAGFIPNMLQKGAIDLLLTKPMSRPLILLFKYVGGLLFVLMLTAVAVGGVWVVVGLRTGVWSPGLLYSVGGITFYFAILYACSTLVGVLTRNPIVSIVVTVCFWFLLFLIGFIYNTVTTLNNLEIQQPTAQARENPGEKADPGKDQKKDQKKAAADAPADGEGEPANQPQRVARVPEWVVTTAQTLNRVAPRTNDLDKLTERLIGRDLLSPVAQRQAGFHRDVFPWAEVLGVAGVWIALLLGLAMLRFVTRSY
jgi:ABC-type transport system involved in multi-copper enzyme maturation permease subunit